MRREMGPSGGAGLLLIGMGGALIFHFWLVGALLESLSRVLLGLALIVFGVSMIRSDRRRMR